LKPVDLPTTTELLDGLHQEGNRAAWDEFDRRYRPLLLAFLHRAGVPDADADDVAQETLTCFLRDYRSNKYDRQKGRLRSWLIAIARHRLLDQKRSTGRRREQRGESAIVHLPDDSDAEFLWEQEERRLILAQAIRELRETAQFRARTLEAFDRVVMRHEPIDQVCKDLDLTPQEIYNAKNRVVARLREIAQRYEAAGLCEEL
jgi:RNA polymerase sigma-70 factor (ECF subfamily)